MTTTTDFALIPAVPTLDFSQSNIFKAMALSDTITHTLTISNSGVIDLQFDVQIKDDPSTIRLTERMIRLAKPLTKSQWGLRDLAFDGVYLYASDSNLIQPRSLGFLALWKKWNADDADLTD